MGGTTIMAPEPSCNKEGLPFGKSTPQEALTDEEQFFALPDLVAWQATVQAVAGIMPAAFPPTGSGLRVDSMSGALLLAYGGEDAPSGTTDVQCGKETSGNFTCPALIERDAGLATATDVCGTVRGSLESSSEDAAPTRSSIPTSCATAACWQGVMISRGMVLGCTCCLVAVIDVLYQVLKETLTGEESLENTLARGTLRKTTLESIVEEEEEWEDNEDNEEWEEE